MIDLYCDFETTGLNPHTCEIVEGYLTYQNKELHFYNKPEVWSDNAEQVHKICKTMVSNAPSITENLRSIIEFFPKDPFNFICYSNVSNNFVDGQSLGYYHYDWAVLQNQFHWHGHWHWFMSKTRHVNVISLHTVAKQILKGKVKKFNQKNVANYFGIEYNEHNAKEDVQALKKIHEQLKKVSHGIF